MNKIFLTFAGAAMMAAGQVQAQRTPIEKYPQVPAVFCQTFLDYVQNYPASRINVGNGQYFGQTNEAKQFYGFGSYNDNSGQRIGFFRDGAYEYGIALTSGSAIIGSATEHVAYSLSTGRIEYIVYGGERTTLEPGTTNDYAFVSMNYANGDRYVGETYQNHRHGFGIYYYAKGGFWFGQYDKDVCQGPGCLFRADNTMRIGYYQHGYEQRMREVLPGKK